MSVQSRSGRRVRLLGSVSALAVVISGLVVAQSNSVSQADNTVGDVGTVVPARLLDTRSDGETIDGQFEAAGKVQAGTFTKVKIAGRGNVPANAVAAELNITAIQNEGLGYATLYPCTNTPPTASTLNYTPGVTIANATTVALNSAGEVCIFTLATSHYALDVVAYIKAPQPPTNTTTPTTTTPDGQCSRNVVLTQVECDALDALYDSTNGPDWINDTGWNTETDPCDWFGVKCDATGVALLALAENQLTSSLPAQIGDLTNLTVLDLGNNQLTSLPAEIGDLTNLTLLSLDGNRLTSLPAEIGNLTNLDGLFLFDNQLAGSVDGWVDGLRVANTLLALSTFNQTGCITASPANTSWLENLDPFWNDGCP